MATKTEIKKWIKEYVEPTIKPYGYKLANEKKYIGGAYSIYRITEFDFTYLLIAIYTYKEVQLGFFDVINLPLTKKLYEITNDDGVNKSPIFQLPETSPHHDFIERKDMSYRDPIESKEQLKAHVQPGKSRLKNQFKVL